MLLFWLFILLASACLLGGIVLAMRALRRRARAGFAFSLLLVVVALVFLLGLGASRSLEVQSFSLSLAGGDGETHLRVAFCSDLHLGLYKGSDWTEKLTQVIRDAKPDLVLYGGDFIYRISSPEIAPLLQPLASMKPPLGAYAVLGNHDYGFPGLDVSTALKRDLSQDGVRVLCNEEIVLPAGLVLIGLDDLWAGKTRSSEVQVVLEERSGPVLVLCHNPDALLEVPSPEGPGGGVPSNQQPRLLWLFGHTHGGQVQLPFFDPLYLPTDLPYDRGLFQTRWGRIFITQGAGETTLPVRLFTRPEVVLLDLSY